MAKSDKGNPMMSFFRRMRAPEELPVAINNREKFDLAQTHGTGKHPAFKK